MLFGEWLSAHMRKASRKNNIMIANQHIRRLQKKSALNEIKMNYAFQESKKQIFAFTSAHMLRTYLKALYKFTHKMKILHLRSQEWVDSRNSNQVKSMFIIWIKRKYKTDGDRAANTLRHNSLKKKSLRGLLRHALSTITHKESNEKAMLLHCFHINKTAFSSLQKYAAYKANLKKAYNTIAQKRSSKYVHKQIPTTGPIMLPISQN
jgi:hypothetical protein